MKRYKVIAKQGDVVLKVFKIELNRDNEIDVIWFKNKHSQTQWAFTQGLDEFKIEEVDGE